MTKLLITKLQKRPDGNVDLFGRGHRYKDTTLFDVSDLFEVGIDPADLQVGVETPCRFYAHCVASSKLNKSGNPYLNVEYLEAVSNGNGNGNGHQAAPAGELNSAILDELRAVHGELTQMRRLLNRAFVGQVIDPPLVTDDDPTEPPTGEGDNDLDDPDDVPRPPATSAQPLSDDQARRNFSSLAGPAIREGQVTSEEVNELVKGAIATGWRDALVELQALIAQAESEQERELVAVYP